MGSSECLKSTLLSHLDKRSGRSFPTVDFIMIWISAVGVPLLVLAVAPQWWFPRSDRRGAVIPGANSSTGSVQCSEAALILSTRATTPRTFEAFPRSRAPPDNPDSVPGP
jgi:hypothetical protein